MLPCLQALAPFPRTEIPRFPIGWRRMASNDLEWYGIEKVCSICGMPASIMSVVNWVENVHAISTLSHFLGVGRVVFVACVHRGKTGVRGHKCMAVLHAVVPHTCMHGTEYACMGHAGTWNKKERKKEAHGRHMEYG